MKNIRTKIDTKLEKLDQKWRGLPVRTQIRYVLYLFAFYLIMGVGVLVKVCYDLGRADKMEIGHIDAIPVIKGDSVLNEQKTIRNGRERE